ncbi:M3 family metallopeptidase [Lyngbya confervoides]|uniref:oligopeptidase A n=1 Tax=Lyngbya confervoides BDU141951 TaxID=1574623 RepID=A0ABD4T675_9CYAN|nr:M3 family metallopeptidase [Lyngbya confervoides]MCM1984204.1 M3 family metallopeptidase [Lyngbya confervoides BDU141951]
MSPFESSSSLSENPLLIGQGLPPFDRIQAEHVAPAVTALLQTLGEQFSDLEAQVTATWDGLVEPLEAIEEKLSWTWGIVGHLMGVKNSPELRSAYESVQPQVIEFINRLNQSRPIYEAFKTLRKSQEWGGLAPAQQRIVETSLRNAELSGVGLEGQARDRFNAIQMELANLSTQFSNNTLDATQSFKLLLRDPSEVAGLPESALSLAAQMARAEGHEAATAETGPWLITLDFPSFGPFMQHAQRRDLREKLYRAYISRAASGEYDNSQILERILALRQEEAKLLGYETFAEVSLASKMAEDVATIEALLEELRKVSYPAAQSEYEQLQSFAQATQGEDFVDLRHWDISYWSERLREEKYELTDEMLRPYFSLPKVLDGLFALVHRLFGVNIVAADGEAPVWHPDVRYFQVNNAEGEAVAHFYLDPYSRPAEKRGGAWMDDCLGRALKKQGDRTYMQLPVAYLVCNQTPPVDEKPSLMTFQEVETLFHEFGHGLQHMLTQVDFAGAAGINNVEWDAVELPSQFMENWCYDRVTLLGMAQHYQTGESLPEEYYQKLLAARTYMSGSAMLRQLHFALVDLELHHRYQPGSGQSANDIRNQIAETTTVLKPLPDDSFLCAFGHIFAGGYAAGYYSYKWAEVLSADAFAAFEEVGLNNEEAIQTIGRRFMDTVLGLGGSLHPMEVFKAFRDREPQTEALLRHSGLLAA